MVGIKAILPVAVLLLLFGVLVISSYLSPQAANQTKTQTVFQTETTTSASTTTVFVPQTTTVSQTSTLSLTNTVSLTTTVSETGTTTVTENTTVTATQVVTTTVTQSQGNLANVTLVVNCLGCSPGVSYYSGTITNGTTANHGTTSVQGSGNVTYVFQATPSQVVSGRWSVSWSIFVIGGTGNLEVKAYFNSTPVSDRTTVGGSGGLSGEIDVTSTS